MKEKLAGPALLVVVSAALVGSLIYAATRDSEGPVIVASSPLPKSVPSDVVTIPKTPSSVSSTYTYRTQPARVGVIDALTKLGATCTRTGPIRTSCVLGEADYRVEGPQDWNTTADLRHGFCMGGWFTDTWVLYDKSGYLVTEMAHEKYLIDIYPKLKNLVPSIEQIPYCS